MNEENTNTILGFYQVYATKITKTGQGRRLIIIINPDNGTPQGAYFVLDSTGVTIRWYENNPEYIPLVNRAIWLQPSEFQRLRRESNAVECDN